MAWGPDSTRDALVRRGLLQHKGFGIFVLTEQGRVLGEKCAKIHEATMPPLD